MIWNYIQEKLSANVDVMLMLIIETKGSCPGKKGFKMAVAADGSIFGTLGGGNLEFDMVELARKQLHENKQSEPIIVHKVHKHNDPNSSGMICSGEQKNMLFPLYINHLETIKIIVSIANSNSLGLLAFDNQNIYLYHNDECKHLYHKSELWIYSEFLGQKDTVYIFGAGHISVPLSQILSILDFRVEVFDNRVNLNTFEANNYANSKHIIDYNDAAKYVAEGKHSYVAIMTFGHSFDELVLRQFLKKDLKYLGMIGSKGKVKEVLSKLTTEGYSQHQVDRVCSPIGLPIGGSSATEIAVSIAAQLVQFRNNDDL